MKVKFIASLCGGSEDYHHGDERDIEDTEALRLIDADIAVPKNKKEYEAVIAKIDQVKAEEAEKEAQATAILEKEALVLDLVDLYRQVARKAAQIEGVILTDEEVEAFVEKSMNGEDPSDEGKQDSADNTANTKSSIDEVPPKVDGE